MDAFDIVPFSSNSSCHLHNWMSVQYNSVLALLNEAQFSPPTNLYRPLVICKNKLLEQIRYVECLQEQVPKAQPRVYITHALIRFPTSELSLADVLFLAL